jgi:hypothetical protein
MAQQKQKKAQKQQQQQQQQQENKIKTMIRFIPSNSMPAGVWKQAMTMGYRTPITFYSIYI